MEIRTTTPGEPERTEVLIGAAELQGLHRAILDARADLLQARGRVTALEAYAKFQEEEIAALQSQLAEWKDRYQIAREDADQADSKAKEAVQREMAALRADRSRLLDAVTGK